MNSCIKCGRQIPEGELFCMECGLNPGSSLFEEAPRPVPVGRMQTPQPRKPAPRPVAVAEPVKKTKSEKKKSSGKGLKVAFALVCLLLAGVVGLVVYQYADILTERERLEAKSADLLLQEQEMNDLLLQIDELNAQIETLQETVEAKDGELVSLRDQLTGVQNNPSQYEMYTIRMEIDRLEEENAQLLLLEEEKEAQIKELNNKLAAMAARSEKADFLDKYVVFAINDDSRVYHSYDCALFTKKNFWAYSRRLAERSGFEPCEVCQGTPVP